MKLNVLHPQKHFTSVNVGFGAAVVVILKAIAPLTFHFLGFQAT